MLCVVLVLSSLHAAVWLDESFNYADGPLEQTTNGLELHKWMCSLKPADANGVSPQVVNRNLTYAGYPGSGKGKSVVLDAAVGAESSSQRISVYYLDTLGQRDTVDMYAAFLLKPVSTPNTSGRDLAVWEGSVASSMVRGRLMMVKPSSSSDKVQLGISKNNSKATSQLSPEIQVGSVVLVVMKYEYHPGQKNDVLKLWVNPTLNTSEAANTALVCSDADISANTDMIVRGFGLRQRGNGAEISGLRIATTWEDALGMQADGLLLESSVPVQNGNISPSSTALQLVFNKPVAIGTAVVTLTEIGGATVNLTPVVSDKNVSLPVSLAPEKDYQLTIPAGAFISGTAQNVAITINFTTRNPDVYAVEEFDYAVGSALEGQGGWVVSTATADQGGASPKVGEGALTYEGYGASGRGHCMLLDSVAQEITGEQKRNTLLPFTNDKLSTEDGENVVYTAFMINMSEMGSTSGKDIFSYIKQGANDGANTTMRGRVQARIVKDKMVFGIRKNSQEITQWSDSIEKSATALLVVKYINRSSSSANEADEFYMYVNPDPAKTEAENSAVMLTADGNDTDGGADLRYICFRQMKLQATVSGIRVAKTWESAMAYADGQGTHEDALDNLQTKDAGGSKLFMNGTIYIVRDGNVFTITGIKVK